MAQDTQPSLRFNDPKILDPCLRCPRPETRLRRPKTRSHKGSQGSPRPRIRSLWPKTPAPPGATVYPEIRGMHLKTLAPRDRATTAHDAQPQGIPRQPTSQDAQTVAQDSPPNFLVVRSPTALNQSCDARVPRHGRDGPRRAAARHAMAAPRHRIRRPWP